MTGVVIGWVLGVVAGTVIGYRHGNWVPGAVIPALFGPLFGIVGLYCMIRDPEDQTLT